MHHSDFIVVEKRLAKTQKELAARDRRIAELEAENERLLGILQFSRWTHDTHRPSYALNCLYEGEITIARFCEWMKAFVAGVDEPLPDVKYRSCGFEFAPKELEAENERLRAALEAAPQLAVNVIAAYCRRSRRRFGVELQDAVMDGLREALVCENQAALAAKEKENG